MHNFKSEQNNLLHHIREFPNHDVTKTGLTWPKSQTRLGKNIESISINHKQYPFYKKTIGMKSKQWIFSGFSKMKSRLTELSTYVLLASNLMDSNFNDNWASKKDSVAVAVIHNK